MQEQINRNRLINLIWGWKQIREQIEYMEVLTIEDHNYKLEILNSIDNLIQHLEKLKETLEFTNRNL